MPLIKPRTERDRKVRHICRLTEANRDTLFDYARMIETLEALTPRSAPSGIPATANATASRSPTPRAHTVDHVLNQVIAKTLATDREFLQWRDGHAAPIDTTTAVHDDTGAAVPTPGTRR